MHFSTLNFQPLYVSKVHIMYMFRAFEEFALSADNSALSRNSQKARQSADSHAFWESPNGAALPGNPQKAQRFLGIPRRRTAFWESPEGAPLSGNPQKAQRFLGIPRRRSAFWESTGGAALSGNPLQLATQRTFPVVQP